MEEIVSTVLEKTQLHFSNRRELNRLMHQACLLAWSAFETYCKEVFVAAVNQRPALYSALLKVQPLKERFAVSTSGWPGLLEAHGYDLNGKLGTIIGTDKDFRVHRNSSEICSQPCSKRWTARKSFSCTSHETSCGYLGIAGISLRIAAVW